MWAVYVIQVLSQVVTIVGSMKETKETEPNLERPVVPYFPNDYFDMTLRPCPLCFLCRSLPVAAASAVPGPRQSFSHLYIF